MSYEGREQHICANGHQFDTNAKYQFDESPVYCQYCGAESVWYNPVDDTNGEAYGEIVDWRSLQLTAGYSETCNLGHLHVIEEATYRIPTKEELEKLQCFFSQEDCLYRPVNGSTE